MKLTSVTDYIVLSLCIFCAWNGWRLGIMRALINPFSFLISCVISVIYFQKSQNLWVSLLIGIFSPLAINIILSSLLTIWQKTANGNQNPSLISRLLGTLLNPLWSMSILFVFLVILAKLPSENFLKLKPIQEDLNRSLAFSWIERYLLKDALPLKQLTNTFNILKDPSRSQALASTKEYQTIINDEKIQNILSDETLRQQIKDADVGKLLTNPKIQSILKDPELVGKFLNLEKILWKEKIEEGNEPNVYEMTSKKKITKSAGEPAAVKVYEWKKN